MISILSRGRRLMSKTRVGVSTFSFIRSISVVPPPMNRTSAPCCAVFDCAPVAMAAAGSGGRMNSKLCMKLSLRSVLSGFANLLGCGGDIGGGDATTDVAAHQFFHRRIVWTASFFEERDCRHDLTRSAVAALIAVTSNKSRLHRMHCVRCTETFDRRDLVSVVHQ